MFDLSPFAVRMRDNSVTFLQFLTSLCAIVGGVVTLAGLVDSILHHVWGGSSGGGSALGTAGAAAATAAAFGKPRGAGAGVRLQTPTASSARRTSD